MGNRVRVVRSPGASRAHPARNGDGTASALATAVRTSSLRVLLSLLLPLVACDAEVLSPALAGEGGGSATSAADVATSTSAAGGPPTATSATTGGPAGAGGGDRPYDGGDERCVPDGPWQEMAPVPSGTPAALLASGGQVLVLAEGLPDDPLLVHQWDAAADLWSTLSLTPPPERRFRFAWVALPDGRILVTGGVRFSFDYSSTAELWDLVAHTVEVLEPLPHAAYDQLGALVDDDTIVIAGGEIDGGYRPVAFDIATETFVELEPLDDNLRFIRGVEGYGSSALVAGFHGLHRLRSGDWSLASSLPPSTNSSYGPPLVAKQGETVGLFDDIRGFAVWRPGVDVAFTGVELDFGARARSLAAICDGFVMFSDMRGHVLPFEGPPTTFELPVHGPLVARIASGELVALGAVDLDPVQSRRVFLLGPPR